MDGGRIGLWTAEGLDCGDTISPERERRGGYLSHWVRWVLRLVGDPGHTYMRIEDSGIADV